MLTMENREARLRLVWNADHLGGEKSKETSNAVCIGTKQGRRGMESVSLSEEGLNRGLYISGKPRTGKSTAILNLVLDDFRQGRAAAVIDPHGELITAILRHVRLDNAQDEQRVVVVDPCNLDRPIGIDLLDARDQFEEDLAIQFMIELIERITPPFARGPVLYQGVRNSMRLVFDYGGRLTDIPELLTNRAFRLSRVAAASDPWLYRYWSSIFPDLAKSTDDGGFVSYVTSKFSQFLEDRCLRNIFGQRGGLDFGRALESGELLLFDLRRGRLGNLNSQFLGMVILHSIERAVMRRSAGRQDSRDPASLPFRLYIDEVHEFDVENLRRMITAFPKHNAAVVMANQSLADLGQELQRAIMGSVSTFLMLRQGADCASVLETLTQPRFDARDLARLSDHEAVVRSDDLPPPRTERVALNPPPPHRNRDAEVEALRQGAAMRIGRDRREVEEELSGRIEGAVAPDARDA